MREGECSEYRTFSRDDRVPLLYRTGKRRKERQECIFCFFYQRQHSGECPAGVLTLPEFDSGPFTSRLDRNQPWFQYPLSLSTSRILIALAIRRVRPGKSGSTTRGLGGRKPNARREKGELNALGGKFACLSQSPQKRRSRRTPKQTETRHRSIEAHRAADRRPGALTNRKE